MHIYKVVRVSPSCALPLPFSCVTVLNQRSQEVSPRFHIFAPRQCRIMAIEQIYRLSCHNYIRLYKTLKLDSICVSWLAIGKVL